MIIQTTRMRFVKNLWDCIAWVAYAIVAVAVAFAIFMVLARIGGSPSARLPLVEEAPYALIGVGRTLVFAWWTFVYVVIPLLACAGFKTWVLRR